MRNDIPAPSRRSLLASPRATLGLAEAVNHLLDRGVVLAGDGVVSLGGVDLVYLGLNLVLSSTETLRRHDGGPLPPSPSPRRRGGAGPHPTPLPEGEGGGLDDAAVEHMGVALMELEAKMDELRALFDLDEADLNLDLGPLGQLL